jgi:hypothetical protein
MRLILTSQKAKEGSEKNGIMKKGETKKHFNKNNG